MEKYCRFTTPRHLFLTPALVPDTPQHRCVRPLQYIITPRLAEDFFEGKNMFAVTAFTEQRVTVQRPLSRYSQQSPHNTLL